MIRRVASVVLLATLAACSSAPPWVEESPVNRSAPGTLSKPAQAAPSTTPRPTSHIVVKGDTMFSIAWRYGMDYHELARLNGIDEPYTIYPGQKLKLTDAPSKPTAVHALPKPAISVPPASNAPTKPSATKPAIAASAPSASAAAASGAWQWPARGKIVDTFNPNTIGPKGLGIAGNAGDPVRAARDGRVVYTGSGLVGYGQLVIVKHDDVYLSAYAHNSRLLVKEGDAVKAGDVIAEMGNSGTDRTELHFEVRRNGDPIDPLTVLPKP